MKLFSRFLVVLSIVLGIDGVVASVVWAQAPIGNNSQEGLVASAPVNPEPGAEVEQVQTNNPYLEYNKNSIQIIPAPHILFRRKIWREIYLKELKNKPFFSRGQEITKFILDGVKEGTVTPYFDETFSKAMTQEQFMEQLSMPKEEASSGVEKSLADNDNWGDKVPAKKDGAAKESDEAGDFFLPNELTTLEIMEELIFNKVNSTFFHDIQSVKIIIPAEKFPTGLRRNVATFKYKELAAYFDTKKDAVWVNVKNNAANIRFTEAIELRLFDSRIVKVENPDNLTLEDIYNKTPNQHLYASKEMEEELIELDQFLWEN